MPLAIPLKVQVQLRAGEAGEDENCLGWGFPWNAMKNEVEPVEFSMAYEQLVQMPIADTPYSCVFILFLPLSIQ